MIGWGLILYYLTMFVLPGHEWLWWNAEGLLPVRLSQPFAYTVAVVMTLALCIGISWTATRLLQRDDSRWNQYVEASRATGWIGFADVALAAAALGGVAYAASQGLALYGVLAAGLPILLLAIGARPKRSGEEADEQDKDREAPSPPNLAQVRYERLEEEAEVHFTPHDRRDTEFHSHLFWPSATSKSAKHRSKPYRVSWVVSREENVAALRESPRARFGSSITELRDAIEQSAQQRVVQFLAEQVAGSPETAVESRFERLVEFLNEAISPAPDNATQRLPVTVLAEARASDAERTVCLISLALGLGIPVGLWIKGGDFGAALPDLPSGALGMHHEVRTETARYSLHRANSADVQVIELRCPPTAGRKPPEVG